MKSSPTLHEQRKQLERAKTSDILKAKIQQRPNRQELERRHILEHDESHVDPSLAERQRMLKKARLADQLNSQLSHRPGPLELIKKNILHTDEPIERCVKQGLIPFKATSEGLLNRPQQPNGYTTCDGEDDSLSSESDQQNSPVGQDSNELPAVAVGIESQEYLSPNNDVLSVVQPSTIVTQTKLPPAYPTTKTLQVKPATTNYVFTGLTESFNTDHSSSIRQAFQIDTLPALTPSPLPFETPVQDKCDAPGKDKNRKKNKPKTHSKPRLMKFHEYKGPANAQKINSSTMGNCETSYQLLLKQQNLLEHLENLHKNASALPASVKATKAITQTFSVNGNYSQPVTPVASNNINTKPASPVSANLVDTGSLVLSKLEKMKVSDLKMLLKTRNLPVSGPKPQLIERLKPFVQSDAMETSNGSTVADCNAITDEADNVSSPQFMETDASDMQDGVKQKSNEELLREQQRTIDELQRQLKKYQDALQQTKTKQTSAKPIIEMNPAKPEVLNQKQIFKQQLEAKIQKEKLLKLEHQHKLQMEQQQNEIRRKQGEFFLLAHFVTLGSSNWVIFFIGFSADNIMQCSDMMATKPCAATNFAPHTAKNPNEIVWNESTILLVKFPDDKKYVLSTNPQTARMENIIVPITTTTTPQNINTFVKKLNGSSQIQQSMATPPLNLQLTQIAAPVRIMSLLGALAKVSENNINFLLLVSIASENDF